MSRPRFGLWIFAISLVTLNSGAVRAQDYPSKPIRIVTTPVGGGNDRVARLIAQGISGPLGQPIIVDNRAGGIIAGELVSRAPPDGYTLISVGTSFLLAPLMQKTPYDSVTDFLPISLVSKEPAVLAVHPSVPAKSVRELIALAKTRPGELNYGSGPIGSSSHLAGELFKSMAGVNMVRVPYKNTPLAMSALTGGETQVIFVEASLVIPHMKEAARVRPLAVASAQASVLFPSLPTVASSGLPGFESATMAILLAPSGTPATIIHRLNQEIVRVLNMTDVKERFFSLGSEIFVGSPEQAAVTIKADMARLGKVIKEAGIKAD